MIVVAGEALVDLIVRRRRRGRRVPGGGPFNAARAIGRLGVPVAFSAACRRRARGVEARSLAADGVSIDLVQRTDRPTTRAFAELDDGGEAQYRFYVEGTSAPALDAARCSPRSRRTWSRCTSGRSGLVFEPIATTIEASWQASRTTSS